MSEVRNQCMGCQAGWPLRPSIFPRTSGSYSPIDVHEVVGGYPHEVVACTALRYLLPDEMLFPKKGK